MKAAVFDLDGLLIDSEPIQIDAWERFLNRYGHSLEPGVLARLYGLRIWDTAALVIELFGLPLTVDEVVAERDRIFFAALSGKVRPMPFAVETVEHLGQIGLRLALATSGHREYVDAALAGLGLRGAFAVEITGGDVAHGKPAPDIYLAAAARLGLLPAECVAFEDAPHGVASAKAAGMWCLAIPNEMTSELPGFAAADAVLGSLGEVVPWLRQRGLIEISRP